MSADIEIIVRGVAVRGGCVLVCRSRKKGNTFLPGGHIEFGEPARAALAREMKEETGLAVRIGRFLGASEHSFRHKGRRVCEINLVFEMRLGASARAVRSQEPKLEFSWIPLRSLPASALQPFTLRLDLPLWLAGKTPRGPWSSSYAPA